MQDFAVYFDSNKYKYKEADIFSAAYTSYPSDFVSDNNHLPVG